MLLGLAKGKVGDLVFYRDGGEQRTRTRVIPKNPRTFAQQAQRVKIANVAGLYRAAATILKYSFSNRPSNQSGYNAFAATAIANAPYLTKQQAASAVVLPQPAMISRGVLPSLDYVEVVDEPHYGIGLPFVLGENRPSTIGEVVALVLAQNPSFNEGDELHFCTLRFSPIEGVDTEVDLYSVVLVDDELILDTSDSRSISDGSFTTLSSSIVGRNAAINSADAIFCSAIIHSRVDSTGKLQASTQWLWLSTAAATLYDGYRSSEALEAAIESYNATATPVLR